MPEKDSSGYYIRGEDGKAFGPVEIATLVEWAGDSRIGPTSSVSKDQKHWVAAPLVPELGMTWLVEAEQGVFYGPFNRRVVDGLLEAGTIARDTRLYELSGGASAGQAKLKAELDDERALSSRYKKTMNAARNVAEAAIVESRTLRAELNTYRRNDPNKPFTDAVRLSNEGSYDLHLALHSNAAGRSGPESPPALFRGPHTGRADLHVRRPAGNARLPGKPSPAGSQKERI